MNKPPLALALALTLGACTTALPPEKTPALGPPFNEEVKQGYVRLASASLSAVDLGDYHHFRDKARAAMLGDDVFPDKVASREIPAETRDEALALRERLVAALEGSARMRQPERAAEAQVSFDCWLMELEAGTRSDELASCREALLGALEETEVAALEVPDSFEVHFETGQTALDASDLAIIDEAARAAGLAQPRRIEVVGYADRSGAPGVNQTLSERRAEAVATALIQAGAPAAAVESRGEGGVGEPGSRESRRVEIRLTR